MKQPDLGKKISELRKAKGLTQEELIEKCNISVRTLQRIESGEVTPRSYTVKIIFAALGYDFYNSSDGFSVWFVKTGLTISSWLGQLYRYVFDLFNLKTNTMKKIMILSVPFLTVFFILLFTGIYSKAQDKIKMRESYNTLVSDPGFVRQFNNGQIDSVCTRYLDNACFMPDQYPTIYGKDNIHTYWQQLYNRGIRFTDTKATFSIVSDSIAVERGTWTVSVNQVLNVSGIYLTQWHYVNGTWKIENDMSRTENLDVEANK